MEYLEVRDAICVLAVAEEQSFSRAAERCYISQSALSKIIRKTERNLGVELFSRGCVPVRPTAEGERFLGLFRKMYDTHLEMEQLSDEIWRRKKSDLSIWSCFLIFVHTSFRELLETIIWKTRK